HVLAETGVLGTSIVWFERAEDNESPLPQHAYRRLALASVGTHDLPPTLAYLRGEHIALHVLAETGVLGTSIVWFERAEDNESPLPQHAYRR
ncbi:4-alpha-glucanotransferase, partial [Bacteroides fragilis]|nr:4-alpha-glucanotransferase [Bacteroides fragilis]